MHRHAIVFTLAAALALSGCQTITEELPSQAAPGNPGAPTVVPVVVVPVPVPTPAPVAPPPAQPGPTQPPPTGGAPPPQDEPDGDGPDIPSNTNPVAKLTAKVYFVECFGKLVDYPPAPVGCRIHMDVTPTDSSNKHTQAKGTPRWTYTNMSLIVVGGNSPYNPVLDAKGAGNLDAWAEVDGIRSNTVHIQIQ